MFLYFLQKKEFLAGDRNFLKNQYNKLHSDLEDTDFYNQVLKLQELDRIAAEVERGMRSLNFFQWHLHFNEVFQQQGGFDIVMLFTKPNF